MKIVQICVGSSCHLKGSEEIVKLFEKAVEENSLKDDITLAGSFCLGKCSSEGVSVTIDDDIYCGITKENFNDFFEKHILEK